MFNHWEWTRNSFPHYRLDMFRSCDLNNGLISSDEGFVLQASIYTQHRNRYSGPNDLRRGPALESRIFNSNQTGVSKATCCGVRCRSSHFVAIEASLFWFTLTARLDVMIQVWHSGEDQSTGILVSFSPPFDTRNVPHVITSVRYDLNSEPVWPQHLGLSVHLRHVWKYLRKPSILT